MPTLFRERGFRFFFYSNERQEPCHIHVLGRGGEAKFWIPSCELAFAFRLSAKDLKDVLSVVRERVKKIEEEWNEFFQSGK